MGCAQKGSAAPVSSRSDQPDEGEYRPLPGGRDHRRVSGGGRRAGVSDYLWESGVQIGGGGDRSEQARGSGYIGMVGNAGQKKKVEINGRIIGNLIAFYPKFGYNVDCEVLQAV